MHLKVHVQHTHTNYSILASNRLSLKGLHYYNQYIHWKGEYCFNLEKKKKALTCIQTLTYLN